MSQDGGDVSGTLHVGLRRNFLGTFGAVAVGSFLQERRTLGGGKRQRSRVWPYICQLRSLLAFGGAFHIVLQQPGSEGIALHIQHCAGAVTEGRWAISNRSVGETTCLCDFSSDTHTSQSTARISEMSLVGSPTASRMMARVNTPPAGIPAAPTLEAVAVTLANGKGALK